MARQAANSNTSLDTLRLDPFALPVRYMTKLDGPMPSVAAIHLERDRVTVRRPLGGIDATVACPLSAYRGVAVRMTIDPETDRVRAVVELLHRDPAMSLPLAIAEDFVEPGAEATGDAEDIAADWQAWGKALGLPLLIVESDGTVREALPRIGGLLVHPAKARRMVASLAKRRPRFLKRRRTGRTDEAGRVLEGREIIARD